MIEGTIESLNNGNRDNVGAILDFQSSSSDSNYLPFAVTTRWDLSAMFHVPPFLETKIKKLNNFLKIEKVRSRFSVIGFRFSVFEVRRL